jgi:WD40 repeat protein
MTIRPETISDDFSDHHTLSSSAAERLSGLLAGLDRLEPILALPEYPATSEVGLDFARFRLRSRLGSGRFGVVLLADDPLLHRQVVVKVPQPAVLADPSLCDRFIREARAAARLDHPGIVAVLEAGEVDRLPYLSATFVPGTNLRHWRLQHPGPTPPVTSAHFVATLANAVQHAHERGVLHCDLTPSNVLLQPVAADEGGLESYLPLVTDFGLARLLDEDPSLTRTFQVAGTPLYMAPEQARGDRRNLTARTDVYAIGVLLYDLLVGAPPYAGETSDVLIQLQMTAPTPPRRRAPGIPRDLNAICLKCLEKNPQDRYSSAGALEKELHQFLAGGSVNARPVHPVVRGARWAAWHPRAAVLLLLALAIVAGAVGVAIDRWVKEVRTRTNLRLQAAEHAAAIARAETFEVRAQAAQFYELLERVRHRRIALSPGWSIANRADIVSVTTNMKVLDIAALRTEAAAVAGAIDLGPPRAIAAGFHAHTAAFDPTGMQLAVAGYSTGTEGIGFVRIVDPTRDVVVRELQFAADRDWEARSAGRLDGCWSIGFSHAGDWLVVGTRSGWLLVWNLNAVDPNPIARWRHSPASSEPDTAKYERITELAFDGEGRLWSGDERTAACWNPVQDWAEAERQTGYLCRPPVGGITGKVIVRDQFHAIHPTSDLSIRRLDQELIIVDRDNQPVGRLALPDDQRADENTITDLVVSPDGTLVAATAMHAGHLKLWDLAGGRLLASRNMAEGTLEMAFRPDGRQLAVVQTDSVQLFDITRSAAMDVVGLGPCPLDDADLTPDGRFLATIATFSSQSGIFRLDVRDLAQQLSEQLVSRTQRAPPAGNSRKRVALSPDGRQVVTHAHDVLARYQVPNTEEEKLARLHDTRDLRFTAAGQLWAAGTDAVRTWQDGESEVAITSAGIKSFATDGECALVGFAEGRIERYGATGELLTSYQPTAAAITGIASQGDRVIAGTATGDLLVLHRDQPPSVIPQAHEDAIWAIAIGPQGWMATGSSDRTVRIWDVNLQAVVTLSQTRPVRRLYWSSDGHTLSILAEGERALRRWHLDILKDEFIRLGIEPELP